MLSLNILLQLIANQPFTDFSDSSDGKNGENFYLKASTENEFSSKSLSFVCDPVGAQNMKYCEILYTVNQ